MNVEKNRMNVVWLQQFLKKQILENQRTDNYERYVNGICSKRHESHDQSKIPTQGMTELWAARGCWKIRFLRAMQV